jgi:hypothetical protein
MPDDSTKHFHEDEYGAPCYCDSPPATDTTAERRDDAETREDDLWRAIRACFGATGAREVRLELLSIRTNRTEARVPVEDQ